MHKNLLINVMHECIHDQVVGENIISVDPSNNNELALPTSLCELIALETNRYAQQNNGVDVSTDEVWIFLGIVILMGIRRLPQIKNYWSMESWFIAIIPTLVVL